jgi:hypothetical protein
VTLDEKCAWMRERQERKIARKRELEMAELRRQLAREDAEEARVSPAERRMDSFRMPWPAG